MALVHTVLDAWYPSSLNKRIKSVRMQTVATGTAFTLAKADCGLSYILQCSPMASTGGSIGYLPLIMTDGSAVNMGDFTAGTNSQYAVSADAITDTFQYVVTGISD
jgi:hypothetical protein